MDNLGAYNKGQTGKLNITGLSQKSYNYNVCAKNEI